MALGTGKEIATGQSLRVGQIPKLFPCQGTYPLSRCLKPDAEVATFASGCVAISQGAEAVTSCEWT
jgi:hypothetical protein